MNFIKKYRTQLIAILSATIIFYGLFLLVLPNVINLNNYKKDVQKLVLDNAKVSVDAKDIKLVTTFDLKAGVKIKDLKISYPDGAYIADAKTVTVKASLLPLIFKTVRVSDVAIERPHCEIKYLKDGQADIAKYFTEQSAHKDSKTSSPQELPFKFSEKLPRVDLKDYNFVIKDDVSKHTLAIKGNSFVFDDAVLNKHFKIETDGKVLINDKQNVNFDVAVTSFWPAVEQKTKVKKQNELPKFDFIDEIVRYNPKADINVDIKIKEHKGHTDFFGFVNADKMSIVLNGKKLPDSYFHLKSNGHKTLINSDLYIAENEKAVLKAKINHGYKNKVDMSLKTDCITLNSVKTFAEAVLKSLNMENDLNSVVTKGSFKADFDVNTDLKKFESSGYLKLTDGALSHKTIPIAVNNIGVYLDFSKNKLSIKEAQAFVNGAKISAKGTVDSKAKADIAITSDNINIASLFNAFAPIELKKDYVFSSGVLKLNLLVKGRLEKTEPNLNLILNKLVLTEKASKTLFSTNSAVLNIRSDKDSFNGVVDVNGTGLKNKLMGINLSAPKLKIKITPDKIDILPMNVYFNSSVVTIKGDIKDYSAKIKTNIIAKGSINAIDLKTFVPDEFKYVVSAKGKIPLIARFNGQDAKYTFDMQAGSNAFGYISPVIIKKMAAKPGLLNVALKYIDGNILVSDCSLYSVNKNTFSDNYKKNKRGAIKIINVNGIVTDILSSHPNMNITASLPQQLALSFYAMPKTTMTAKGEIKVYGLISGPMYRGFLTIRNIRLPEYLTKIQDVDLEFNEQTCNAKIQNLDINGIALNIDADASTQFSNTFLIRSMSITSSDFDADKIFAAMDKINKNAGNVSSKTASAKNKTATANIPLKIVNGKLNIKRFVMKQIGGSFIATDITSDFNLINNWFNLYSLRANTFEGNVKGTVLYNLVTTAVKAKVSGEKINSNSAVSVFTGLKNQIMGYSSFNADVRLKGATYTQQIKSLNGKVAFEVKDGQMGSLGRFETFLRANNLISQAFVYSKIGSIISSISPYNTGKFEYLKGDVKLVNGVAVLDSVKISGPHMAMMLTGNTDILSMNAALQILGTISPEVLSAIGPIGELSVDKFVSLIPKFGTKISSLFNNYNAAANQDTLNQIPKLTPQKSGTKSFKVMLNGNLNNPATAIKRFQWLNTPEQMQKEQESLIELFKPKTSLNKEEMKQQLKDDVKQSVTKALQNNEKVQQIQNNPTVKNLNSIYKFYKDREQTQTAQ